MEFKKIKKVIIHAPGHFANISVLNNGIKKEIFSGIQRKNNEEDIFLIKSLGNKKMTRNILRDFLNECKEIENIYFEDEKENILKIISIKLIGDSKEMILITEDESEANK